MIVGAGSARSPRSLVNKLSIHQHEEIETMLKVNVGLSRKLSKDYNSEGFSINVEGEVVASTSDAEAVVEQIKELYDLAEEALAQQVSRSQSTAAIASRDEEPRASRQNGNGRPEASGNGHRETANNGNGRKDEPATNKQIQYLLSIGKRMKLSTAALEKEIADVLGNEVALYDLTKKQAGIVIDQLTATAGSNRD
jgi:hypothetical protein